MVFVSTSIVMNPLRIEFAAATQEVRDHRTRLTADQARRTMLEPGESVAGIHNDRWLIRQVTSGNQVPDPGAKFLVGHRLDPPSSRSITR